MAIKPNGLAGSGIGDDKTEHTIVDESGDYSSVDTSSVDTDDRIPLIEPETIRFEPSGFDEPKRRGRKPGSRNSSSKSTRKEVSQDLTGLLMGIHFMGATILKVPEMELTEPEAKQLGIAVARVNAEYDGMILTSKQQAWASLLIAAGTVYGPRIMATKIRKKEERKNRGPQTINARPN